MSTNVSLAPGTPNAPAGPGTNALSCWKLSLPSLALIPARRRAKEKKRQSMLGVEAAPLSQACLPFLAMAPNGSRQHTSSSCSGEPAGLLACLLASPISYVNGEARVRRVTAPTPLPTLHLIGLTLPLRNSHYYSHNSPVREAQAKPGQLNQGQVVSSIAEQGFESRCASPLCHSALTLVSLLTAICGQWGERHSAHAQGCFLLCSCPLLSPLAALFP